MKVQNLDLEIAAAAEIEIEEEVEIEIEEEVEIEILLEEVIAEVVAEGGNYYYQLK